MDLTSLRPAFYIYASTEEIFALIALAQPALDTLQNFCQSQNDPLLSMRLTHAQQKGEEMASCHLGVICEMGRDWESARLWYKQAAGRGEVTAQYNLGVLLETGRGGPQDYRQALTCYTEASKKGYAKAQYNLSLLYAKGCGTEQDPEMALYFCSQAAAQGLPEANRLLKVLKRHIEA